MAKGDDAIRKKKNKDRRKKLNRDPASVSARIAAIIATKKRRKAGKRRACEGMCYSLPTPDDPFNERHGKKAPSKKTKKHDSRKQKSDSKNQRPVHVKQIDGEDMVLGDEQGWAKKLSAIENSCPSKFLIMCLNSIQDALRQDGSYCNDDKPLFTNEWGIEFWESFSFGEDILEASVSGCAMDQTAWVVSAAADMMAQKEKEGVLCNGPFLLFLVPSQDKAIKVRSVCRPLKAHGIHAVSLHSGASLDHQIHGLKSCEPEFLVSTPERLLELVAVKAVDLSWTSVMVIDGPEPSDVYVNMINTIRNSLPQSVHTVVFGDCLSYTSVNMVQNLLTGPVCRLSLNESIQSRSACIHQSLQVFASEAEKLSQELEQPSKEIEELPKPTELLIDVVTSATEPQSTGIPLLKKVCGDQLSQGHRVIIIVGEDSNFSELVAGLNSRGYAVPINEAGSRIRKTLVPVVNVEAITSRQLNRDEVVILPDFVPSIEKYAQILTRMGRHTVNGMLHSFFTTENAELAGPLTDILQQCGQAVPETLKSIIRIP